MFMKVMFYSIMYFSVLNFRQLSLIAWFSCRVYHVRLPTKWWCSYITRRVSYIEQHL